MDMRAAMASTTPQHPPDETGDKPATEAGADDKPAPDKQAAEAGAGDKPAPDKQAAEAVAGDKPAPEAEKKAHQVGEALQIWNGDAADKEGENADVMDQNAVVLTGPASSQTKQNNMEQAGTGHVQAFDGDAADKDGENADVMDQNAVVLTGPASSQTKQNNMEQAGTGRVQASDGLPSPLHVHGIVCEIMKFIPPSDTSFVSSALVCRAWRSVFREKYNMSYFRSCNPTTPFLVGFMQQNGDDAEFISAMAFRPSNPVHPGCRVMDCRNGRVLLEDKMSEELVVWNTLTGLQRRVPVPNVRDYQAAIICHEGKASANPLLEDVDFIIVVIAFLDEENATGIKALFYSSDGDRWSPETIYHTYAAGYIRDSSTLLGNNEICFLCHDFDEAMMDIVVYNWDERSLMMIELPEELHFEDQMKQICLASKNKILSLVTLHVDRLCFRALQWNLNGEPRWAPPIELPVALPGVLELSPYYLAGSDTVLISSSVGSRTNIISLSLTNLTTARLRHLGPQVIWNRPVDLNG